MTITQLALLLLSLGLLLSSFNLFRLIKRVERLEAAFSVTAASTGAGSAEASAPRASQAAFSVTAASTGAGSAEASARRASQAARSTSGPRHSIGGSPGKPGRIA